MTEQPGFWNRLGETLFVRRADQTVIAALVMAAIVLVAVWWWRNGGADGKLVDHDQLPQHEAAFVVDVNKAALPELAELPGVGATLAERIVEHRRAHGPFKSADDLLAVKGIGQKTLEQLRPHLSFGDAKYILPGRDRNP